MFAWMGQSLMFLMCFPQMADKMVLIVLIYQGFPCLSMGIIYSTGPYDVRGPYTTSF